MLSAQAVLDAVVRAALRETTSTEMGPRESVRAGATANSAFQRRRTAA